jgi:hypothetical protein
LHVRFGDLPLVEGATGKFLLQQMAAVTELEAGMIYARTKAAPAYLSLPKIPSGLGIRHERQNHRMIGGDACGPIFARMLFIDLFKPRRRLEAENLFLRHQLSIALRRAPARTLQGYRSKAESDDPERHRDRSRNW